MLIYTSHFLGIFTRRDLLQGVGSCHCGSFSFGGQAGRLEMEAVSVS